MTPDVIQNILQIQEEALEAAGNRLRESTQNITPEKAQYILQVAVRYAELSSRVLILRTVVKTL